MQRLKNFVPYVVIGIVVGAVNKWMDEPPDRIVEATGGILGDVGTYPGIWMLVLVVLVSTSKHSLSATLVSASAFFMSVSLGYYAYSEVILGYSGLKYVTFWIIASVTIVPLFSALVWYIREMTSRGMSNTFVPSAATGLLMAVPFATAVGLLLGLDSADNIAVTYLNVIVQLIIAAAIMGMLAPSRSLKYSSLLWALICTAFVLVCFDVLFAILSR